MKSVSIIPSSSQAMILLSKLIKAAILSAFLISTHAFSATPDSASSETKNTTEAQPTEVEQQEPEKILPLPLNELRQFTDIFGKIKNDYVEEIDDATLLKYAIRGMLSSLDPHSAYLEPSDFSELQESTSGTFGGLGIEVSMENGFIKVISPIDDTPAQKGGIEAGDLIVKIDGSPVKGMSLNHAIEIMRGEAGSSVKLTIVRSGERDPIEFKLVRDDIKVTSIKTLTLDDHYGYVRITQFQAQTGPDFVKELEKLKSEADELSGLIIDLRNNPGGVLQASVDVANSLLDDGLIVYTKGRTAISQLSYNATKGDDAEGIPIIVLINGGSASASEILAGALQDHNRAVIMGTRSFGKGSVQNVLSIDATHGLKLTTARYYTPSGRSIQAQGITPDIEVNRAKLSDEKTSTFFKEADLEGHLSNGNNTSDEDGESGEATETSEQERQSAMLERDFQLQEALSLLKAIDILNIKGKVSNMKNTDIKDTKAANNAVSDKEVADEKITGDLTTDDKAANETIQKQE